MNAKKEEIEILLACHGLASPAVGGTGSAAAATGGRIADLTIERTAEGPQLGLAVDGGRSDAPLPHERQAALAIVADLRAKARLPDDASFEHMLADLLVKAAKLFEDSGATKLEFASLHLHPSSYHIGEVTLLHDKPLHLTPRLAGDSHDRRAIFDHRHGDSTKFPK